MVKPFVVEFPSETAELVEQLASSLGLSREEVISRALGLLEVWVQARDQKHIFVERPAVGESGEETEIEIDTASSAIGTPIARANA